MKYLLSTAIAATAAFVPAQAQSQPERPRLVVLCSVDQLARWVFEAARPHFAADGGFRRLLDGGVQFTQCAYEHACTETGPGHATIGTGAPASGHGIVRNEWWSPQDQAKVYCVAEPVAALPDLKEGKDRGPGRLLLPTLGDSLKAHVPGSKVASVSWKDRAAILMAGRSADAVVWFEASTGNLVTNTTWTATTPAWLTEFNQKHAIDGFFGWVWDRFGPPDAYAGLVDDRPYELPHQNGSNQRTLPQPLTGGRQDPAMGFYAEVYGSPVGNTMVRLAAEAVVQALQLGSDPSPDLLCLSFSSTDVVGHQFGPDSVESRDTLLRLDRELATFLTFLDRTVGKGQYAFFLTADHGVGPTPEWAKAHGVDAGRGALLKNARAAAEKALTNAYGAPPARRRGLVLLRPGGAAGRARRTGAGDDGARRRPHRGGGGCRHRRGARCLCNRGPAHRRSLGRPAAPCVGARAESGPRRRRATRRAALLARWLHARVAWHAVSIRPRSDRAADGIRRAGRSALRRAGHAGLRRRAVRRDARHPAPGGRGRGSARGSVRCALNALPTARAVRRRHLRRTTRAHRRRRWGTILHLDPDRRFPAAKLMQRLIDQHPLQRGAHPTRGDGMCAMEMVAWLAGEAHSDEPVCACPVLAAFVRACNDAMSDAQRNRYLRPLVPRLVNTRGSAASERQRGLVVVDALVRHLLPAWLRRHRRADEAKLLGELPPVQGAEDVRASLRAVECFVPDHHAARWVLQRAVEELPPARYVAGAVQVARALNDAETWTLVVETIEQMVLADRPQPPRFAAEDRS